VSFNHDPNVILDFLKKNLAEFRAAPVQKVYIKPQGAGMMRPPSASSLISIYQRMMPVPRGAHESNHAVQRD
jgi:hypothetical protein